MPVPHIIADGPSSDVAELDANFAYLQARAEAVNSVGSEAIVGATLVDPGVGNTRTGTHIRSAGGFYASADDSGSVMNRNTDGGVLSFARSGTTVGAISVTTSGTTYGVSSDYRLKLSPSVLTGSGAFIDALQPRQWTWTVGGSGCGFIAHELQLVSPSSVIGQKDAVDPVTGQPIYQSVGYASPEIIANMVAELQSLRARVAALEAA